MKIIVAVKGGPTSGNFGHSGRPGLVGGSGGGGGGTGGAPSGGKITAAESIRGGTVQEHGLKWVDEETIKGQIVIKHNPSVTPDEDQIKGFIARRLPRLLYFGDPDDGIEDMKLSNVQHHASGYTIVNVEITPTEEQGADWVEHATSSEEYYGSIGEAIGE